MRFPLVVMMVAIWLVPSVGFGQFNPGAFRGIPGAKNGSTPTKEKSDGRPVSEKVINVALTTLSKGLENAKPGTDREKLVKAIAALQAILAEKDVPVAADDQLTLAEKMGKVKAGMTRGQVEKILGPGTVKSANAKNMTLTWGEGDDSASVAFTRRQNGVFVVAGK